MFNLINIIIIDQSMIIFRIHNTFQVKIVNKKNPPYLNRKDEIEAKTLHFFCKKCRGPGREPNDTSKNTS